MRRTLTCSLLFLFCHFSWCYEAATHSRITLQSISNSVITTDQNLLNELGIGHNFGEPKFPSIVPKDINNPNPDEVEFKSDASITEIIRGGSVLEDAEERSLFHFYDPQHGGRSLQEGAYNANYSSMIWSNEGHDNFLQVIPEQEYSYRDALEYFYSGLTASSEEVRKLFLGKMFRSLGHVIHHIQDMAQPQHVRNDQHCDYHANILCWPINNPSHYEKYTDQRRNSLPFTISEGLVPTIPFFSMASEYWDNAAGSGMAEFTSNNFVSQGTNFLLVLADNPLPYPGYPLPALISGASNVSENLDTLFEEDGITAEERADVLDDLNCAPAIRLCKIEFIPTIVTDNYLPSSNNTALNQRASSISLLDDELRKRGLFVNDSDWLTTLNRFNFISAYRFLIPRAVAYGAGLINHYFRGRLQIEKSVNDGNQLTIKVKNVSKQEQALAGDSFELYYDAKDGTRKRINDITVISGSFILEAGKSSELTAELPSDVDPSKDKPYLLVFNAFNHGGLIGKDNGIAAVNFAAEREFSGFLVWPLYTPSDGNDGQRLITKISGLWTATPAPDLEAGNVDWKGQYVNGAPTKVVTWYGEKTRYMPVDNVWRSSSIFQGGKEYSRMPCSVLGAAVQKDSNGSEWIVGICVSSSKIRVMKRPNSFSQSPNMFDPVNEPNGWRELGAFDVTAEKYTSWFFNGNGTEAQSIVRIPTGQSYPNHLMIKRLKITLSGGVASLTEEENGHPVRHDTLTRTHSSSQCHESETTSAKFPLAVDYHENQEIIAYFETNLERTRETKLDAPQNQVEVHAGADSLNTGGNSLMIYTEEGSDKRVDTAGVNNLDWHDYQLMRGMTYFDMRSQLSVYTEEEYSATFAGSSNTGSYIETEDSNDRSLAIIDQGISGHQSLVLEEYNTGGPINTGRNNFIIYDTGSCNSTQEVDIFVDYPTPDNFYYETYAVTDIQNEAAVSFNVGGYFGSASMDQLTGSDLRALIPGGGDDARFEIYLIK